MICIEHLCRYSHLLCSLTFEEQLRDHGSTYANRWKTSKSFKHPADHRNPIFLALRKPNVADGGTEGGKYKDWAAAIAIRDDSPEEWCDTYQYSLPSGEEEYLRLMGLAEVK